MYLSSCLDLGDDPIIIPAIRSVIIAHSLIYSLGYVRYEYPIDLMFRTLDTLTPSIGGR